jgi:predicted lipopolysaccharide heptosyltransferase III
MVVDNHHNIERDIRNILIIQLGDIGDVVWAIPTFWSVKETHPHANISILVREGSGCLLEKDPSIHRIFEVRRYQKNFFSGAIGQFRFIRTLRREHFDLVIDLRADDRGAFMSFITQAPVRVAQYYEGLPLWRNWMFTHLVDPPPLKDRGLGASEQSLRIVRGLGIDAKAIIPRVWISGEVMDRVRELLTEFNIEPVKTNSSLTWVTLNPFSRWPYKEWVYDKWVNVINWLWNEFQIATAVVGSKEEMVRAAELTKKCNGSVYNLVGRTTLAELAGVLSVSGLHIGVDSAAPHIAAAVGTPTITIYGPSNWRDWAPVGDQHRVIVPDMDCVPCQKKGCDGLERSRCLETLNADRVQKVIREELEKRLR